MFSKINDLKNWLKDYKKYFDTISSFEDLNSYVLNSSIFLNRVELILYNDVLSDNEKLNNIMISYSDFKVTNLENNFDNGVVVKNEFDN